MNGDAINAISYYALTGLLFLSAVPFFYIIIFNSPSTIRVYRNTILNLACWYTIGMGTFGLFLQPIQITYFGKSCAKFAGLVSYFGFRLHVLVIVVVAIGVANVTISMLICFFYRYDQIRLRDQPTHLSSIRGVTMCAVLHVLMSLFAGCVAFVIVNGGEIIKHNGLFLLCFGDSNYSTIMKVAVVVATVFGFVFTGDVLLALLTIRSLRSQRLLMSAQTYRLHLLLTVNLIMLLGLPFVFGFLPVFGASFVIFFKLDSLYLWVTISDHAPFLDAILTFVNSLLFITPYREALKRMFCIQRRTDRVHAISVESATVNLHKLESVRY
ncbi:hypothetical protein QR680_016416 [Steinernema hermaphroditum]|uniref:Uncharacterized protein n=1 Tax=Steinernema hermaphroditum TaxID=289476 RepID=A0AA39HC97_9BILA|nr:hypothetical protein QR680_016416 [Steinernema hermaphroditum]